MINVLVVDDSALVRKYLSEMINKAAGMCLADTAMDPIYAVDKIKKHKVDVILLDLEMPRMDGLTFLRNLMKFRVIPVIILSSLTRGNASLSLEALESGAFEVLGKPEDIFELPELESRILETIRAAAQPAVKKKLEYRFKNSNTSKSRQKSEIENRKHFTAGQKTTDKLIVIGSSTGGTTALEELLSGLPVDIPGIVVVQHLPLRYSEAFAQRLNRSLSLTVKLAEEGDRINPGTVYIAPGEQHCSITSSGARYMIKLREGPRVNYHKPSVTVLFNSAANFAASNVVGVMLTGMGDDGAKAMKEMKDAGSYNIIQDEESSVVWGMPGKACEYGADSIILPLDKISDEICRYLK